MYVYDREAFVLRDPRDRAAPELIPGAGAGADPGDVRGGFGLTAEVMVFQGQALDGDDGQFQLLAQLLIAAAELGDVPASMLEAAGRDRAAGRGGGWLAG